MLTTPTSFAWLLLTPEPGFLSLPAAPGGWVRAGVFIPFLRVPSPWAGGLCVVFPCFPNKEQISLKRNVCVCISFPFSFVEVASRGSGGWRHQPGEDRTPKAPQDKAGAEWGTLSAQS